MQGALIAAAYAGLTIILMPIAFGPVQIRLSEALTVLPLFTPAAIPGLFVGCIIANMFSPYGLIDMIFGSLATLLAAAVTYFIGRKIKNRPLLYLLGPLPAVVFNALIIGGVLSFSISGFSGFFPYLILASQVALEESFPVYILGIPLIILYQKYLVKIDK